MEEKKKNVRKNSSRTKKVELTLENLKNIQETQQVLDMLIEDIDENLNMVGKVGKDVKAVIPREEASSVVGEDGMVEERFIVNKKGKVLPGAQGGDRRIQQSLPSSDQALSGQAARVRCGQRRRYDHRVSCHQTDVAAGYNEQCRRAENEARSVVARRNFGVSRALFFA